jgi:hypothetical protein
MQCLQCGAQTPDDEWNCVSCRMNVYWASQHYASLARLSQQPDQPGTGTPPFLRLVHEHAMRERAEHGGRVEHRVRQIARRAMRRQIPAAGPQLPAVPESPSGWNAAGKSTAYGSPSDDER